MNKKWTQYTAQKSPTHLPITYIIIQLEALNPTGTPDEYYEQIQWQHLYASHLIRNYVKPVINLKSNFSISCYIQ